PKSEEEPDKKNQSQNPEVELTRTAVILNGDPVPNKSFAPRLASLLARKERQEDNVVVLKSRKDVSYERWINVTGLIEQAGGIVTLQLEEEQTHIVN
ncbi:MAG: biopolymer transporter ExbD, partial [Opitutae bacterium]|nr:biopolymer transporter ExbD [Opitutae bacterium]